MLDKKILFIDDSPTMRRIIANSLRKIGLVDFIEAVSGYDALHKLEEQPIDIILTDWNMPEMSGEELVNRLRKHGKHNKIPIIMITTRGMKDDVLKAVGIGVNGYIVKPFTPEVLKQKITDVIN